MFVGAELLKPFLPLPRLFPLAGDSSHHGICAPRPFDGSLLPSACEEKPRPKYLHTIPDRSQNIKNTELRVQPFPRKGSKERRGI
jgi:hypothetical protein